jgi:SAM-dependent methyltransferase
MVDLLRPEPGQQILEVAAGPGEVGFLALPRILPDGRLLSTDAAPEMVDVARRRAAELGLTGIDFAVEDAAALSVADDAFDGVICRFGLMLVPNMHRAAAELARVARPGGRVVLAVWASPTLNPWMTAPGRAANELGLIDPPDREAPGPFRLADSAELRAVVTGGGLEVEVVEDVPVTWAGESLTEWWETTRDTSRMLTVLLAQLAPADVAAVRARAEALLAEFVADDGSLAVPGVARVVAATVP